MLAWNMACLKKVVKMQAGYNQSTDKVHNVFVTGCLLVNDADQLRLYCVEVWKQVMLEAWPVAGNTC